MTHVVMICYVSFQVTIAKIFLFTCHAGLTQLRGWSFTLVDSHVRIVENCEKLSRILGAQFTIRARTEPFTITICFLS